MNSNSTSDAGMLGAHPAPHFAALSWDQLQDHSSPDPANTLCDIAISALQSKNFPSAVRAAIQCLGDRVGCSIGNSWRKLGVGDWESMNLWHHAAGGADSRLSPGIWHEITEQLSRRANAEFFDQINRNRIPQSLNANDDRFDSAASDASTFHLQSVAAFPVIADDTVVAVVQLYSQKPIELDADFTYILQQTGRLLGYVFEREQMERRIAHLAEIDRSQVGQQLHDGLSQHLAAAAMLVESLKQRLANERSTQIDMTTKILLALEEAKQQARALTKMMAPIAATSDGFASALSELAEQTRHAFNIDCICECHGDIPPIKQFTAEQLVRFARDAIAYLHKVSRATRIAIILESEAGIAVSVRAYGHPAEIAARIQEDDLRVLQTRVHLVGGELSILCHGQEGTTITCAVSTHGPITFPPFSGKPSRESNKPYGNDAIRN